MGCRRSLSDACRPQMAWLVIATRCCFGRWPAIGPVVDDVTNAAVWIAPTTGSLPLTATSLTGAER